MQFIQVQGLDVVTTSWRTSCSVPDASAASRRREAEEKRFGPQGTTQRAGAVPGRDAAVDAGSRHTEARGLPGCGRSAGWRSRS